MPAYRFLIIFLFVFTPAWCLGQCAQVISAFPYEEGFEINDGEWVPGGASSDWTWGTPSKPVISSAAAGTKCWNVGGLTGSRYNDSEASWLKSPCFDFSSLQYPFISLKVFWETESRFDGAALQYSTDNGNTWVEVGYANDTRSCLNMNWYNQSSINYLSPLSGARIGWSGNIQATSGSCQGGNGSGAWLTASHVMPELAGRPSVIFRFIFGAGSICNNYDGFAIDEIKITEAPANAASFDFTCQGENSVLFTNTSSLCPTTYSWDFGDPASGALNTSSDRDPIHQFSGPGEYTVTLTVSSEGNAPSTITQSITLLSVETTRISPADCNTNTGGSIKAEAFGGTGNYSFEWNTNPVQNTPTAVGLPSGEYTVTVSEPGACPASATDSVLLDLSCIGVFFPNAFTPNGDGLNDEFGPAGSIALITNYQFNVYNRWGERVFHSTNPFLKWKGDHRGTSVGNHIYTWFARYDLPGEQGVVRKGTVMVIR